MRWLEKQIQSFVRNVSEMIGKGTKQALRGLGFSKPPLIEAIKGEFSSHQLFPALLYVNIAQITSVFNDNLFKLLLIFFLLDIQGAASTASILATIGALYVEIGRAHV